MNLSIANIINFILFKKFSRIIKKTCKQLETELTSYTKGGDEMNKNEVKHILENNFLDILQKIFNYMSEELAQTNEQDIKALEKFDNELNGKIELLKQEFKSLDENKKKSISNLLSEYISTRDYIGAYYNEKYFKERSKNRNKINCRNNKIKP